MATQNIPQKHVPQLSRRFGGFLAASAAAGLIVAGTIVVSNRSGADSTSSAPSTGPGSPPAVTTLPSRVSPTFEVVVSSAEQASVYESFFRDTGVTGMQVRVVDSEQAREALDLDISFRRAAGEDVTVIYSAPR